MQRIIDFMTDQARELAALRKEVDALKAEFYQRARPSRQVETVNPEEATRGIPEVQPAAPDISQQAERAAKAEPESAPVAADAERTDAPTDADREHLTARMRKVLRSGADTVEKVKDALRGGMVVRPSAVTTWAEYDALSSLFDSVGC